MSRLRERLRLLPRHWGWSNSAEAWQERAGVLLVVLGILAGYLLFDRIGPAALSFLASLWLATLLLFLRRGWLSLVGPVFLFDLLRTTRRSRYFLLRIYVYFILLLLFCVFITWTSGRRVNLRVNRGAAIAENIFDFFLLTHFALTALFTPGYVAPALTEEKERNTLEALMATDLSSREIVLSKLAVRLANLGLMLLTGLPILAILQVMGGVDPDLMMVGYVAILFFTATLACLAISNSVRSRRTRDAIMSTYLELGAYLGFTSVFAFAERWWLTPIILNLGHFHVDVLHVLEIATYGNPILGLERIVEYLAGGGQLSGILSTVLVQFITFHLIVSIALAADAIRRFRRTFRKQTYGQLVKDSNRLRRLRPAMGNWPLLWKEIFTEAPGRKSWFRWLLMGLLIVASFLPFAMIERNLRGALRLEIIQLAYFRYICVVSCGILCVLLIRVVIQAALAFSRERDQQTLDSLLTCPVSTPSIIGAKWLGCMLSVRWLWLWLAMVWAIGVIMGGMSFMTFVALLALWIVYAGVGTLFGQWCSLVCKTSLRAIIFTLMALVIAVSGVLILPLQMSGFYAPAETTPGFRTWLLRGQFGMAPPIAFTRTVPLKFLGSQAEYGSLASWEWSAMLWGTGIWLGAGVVFWALLCRRVRDQARRTNARGRQEDRIIAVSNEEANPAFSYPVT